MDHCILFIALTVALLSLATGGFIYFRSQRAKRKRNRNIVQHIRQQDQIAKELERTRIEKNMLESILKTNLEQLNKDH
jgi:hypothetical protein